jgi:3-dehydroquinate dehydratase-1
VPDKFPDREDADILKIAVMVNSKADIEKLESLHGQEDNVIIVAMGPLGTPQRVSAPLLGSYLTYCSIGEATAPGQLDLKTLVELYREGGLR